MHAFKRSLELLAWSALLGACTTGLGATEQAIINGQVDNDPGHDAIVALTDVNGDAFCTGSYVGHGTIVTAAHCFDGAPPAYIYFGVDALGDNQACLAGDELACGAFAGVVAHQVFPSYAKDNLEQGGDIAVIDIGGDPQGVAPLPMLSAHDGTKLTATDEAAPIVFVGFGVTDGVNQTGAGVRRIVGGTVAAVGPRTVTTPEGDLPLAADQVYVRQQNGGTCQGDSGGPMLIERGGVEHLVGVTSYGDDGCFTYGVSVLVQAHRNFVRAFQGLPADPEPEPDGNGNGNGGGDDGGGCRIGAGPGGNGTGALLFIGLAVAWTVRRRRRATAAAV